MQSTLDIWHKSSIGLCTVQGQKGTANIESRPLRGIPRVSERLGRITTRRTHQFFSQVIGPTHG